MIDFFPKYEIHLFPIVTSFKHLLDYRQCICSKVACNNKRGRSCIV